MTDMDVKKNKVWDEDEYREKRYDEMLRKESCVCDRYLPVYGPNSKQWWVYDELKDVYIDPPAVVLKKVRAAGNKAFEEALETNGDWVDAEMIAMYEEIDVAMASDDSWLDEDEYWYDNIEI